MSVLFIVPMQYTRSSDKPCLLYRCRKMRPILAAFSGIQLPPSLQVGPRPSIAGLHLRSLQHGYRQRPAHAHRNIQALSCMVLVNWSPHRWDLLDCTCSWLDDMQYRKTFAKH